MNIDYALKRKCAELANSGVQYRDIYDNTFFPAHDCMSFETFRHKIREWRKKKYADDRTLDVANLDWKFTPYAATVQVSGDGKVTQAWVKQKADNGGGYDFKNLEQRFAELERTYAPLEILPATQEGEMIAEVNIADLHLGKLCWRGDTGNNFDYKIARAVFQQIISDICRKLDGQPLEYIIFPIGNDFFNSDNPEKTTTAGTPQDTDVRWQKLQEVGEEMLISAIDMLKTIAPVKALYVPANHDEVTAFGVSRTLRAWFRNDERVEIDTIPMARKYRLYGNTLICFTHGDKEYGKKGDYQKPSTLAALPSVEARELWGQAKYCEVHAAHLHGEHSIEEMNGVIVRRVSSPTATDTWHYRSGFVGNVRKAQTFIYDKEYGLVDTINTPVKQ